VLHPFFFCFTYQSVLHVSYRHNIAFWITRWDYFISRLALIQARLYLLLLRSQGMRWRSWSRSIADAVIAIFH